MLLTVVASLWVVVSVCAILRALDADRQSRRAAALVFSIAAVVAIAGEIQGDYNPYCCESYQLQEPAKASPLFVVTLVVLATGLVLWLVVRGVLGLRREEARGER